MEALILMQQPNMATRTRYWTDPDRFSDEKCPSWKAEIGKTGLSQSVLVGMSCTHRERQGDED